MPKICCKLHRLLDSKSLSNRIKKDQFEEFCKFVQQSWIKRSRTTIEYENPNDMDIFIYLFTGAGTRYLSGLAGQFITFQPGKSIKQAIKWYPVLASKVIPETKSLSYIGQTKLPIALLLLLNYERNYLCDHIHYNLHLHMTVPLQIQCLLFMLSISPDIQLHTIIGERLTSITLCDDSPVINIFSAFDTTESFENRRNIIIRNFFPDFLLVNCKNSVETDTNNTLDSWNSTMASILMNHNWTRTSDASLIPQNQVKETQISKDSSLFCGKRLATATVIPEPKRFQPEQQQIILPTPTTSQVPNLQSQSIVQPPQPIQQSMGTQIPTTSLDFQLLNSINPFFFNQTMQHHNQQVPVSFHNQQPQSTEKNEQSTASHSVARTKPWENN